ncbi:MAG: KamA family radical SAM protein [Myxococcota bacterium]|jgi:lysine 2,3-aminomutase|nr:KamA family radical SAM protein [Myxococcota bacterium]
MVAVPIHTAPRWRHELAGAHVDPAELAALVPGGEPDAIEAATRGLSARVPRGYASLIDPGDPDDPVARMVVPDPRELEIHPHLEPDPLGEDLDAPLPGVVHRYPDRVLLLVTGRCAAHCRFCMRRRLGGRALRGRDGRWLDAVVKYLRGQPAVREVILSGGDPLMLSDGRLDRILGALHAVPQVELLRVDSRAPVVLPSRVTPSLTNMLRSHAPLWFVTHVNLARELTPRVVHALGRLVDAGIPVENQAVLLAGVNDRPGRLERLSRALLRARVRPYYLHQCDLVAGTEHFRVPLQRGAELVGGLAGRVPGLGIPRYVVDSPGGHGKVLVVEDNVVGRQRDATLLRAPDGAIVHYPDPDR